MYASIRAAGARAPVDFDVVSDLFRVRLDGTGARRLTQTSTWEAEPAWSPNRRMIAYTRGDPLCHASTCEWGPTQTDIWVMAANGAHPRPLTEQDDEMNTLTGRRRGHRTVGKSPSPETTTSTEPIPRTGSMSSEQTEKASPAASLARRRPRLPGHRRARRSPTSISVTGTSRYSTLRPGVLAGFGRAVSHCRRRSHGRQAAASLPSRQGASCSSSRPRAASRAKSPRHEGSWTFPGRRTVAAFSSARLPGGARYGRTAAVRRLGARRPPPAAEAAGPL